MRRARVTKIGSGFAACTLKRIEKIEGRVSVRVKNRVKSRLKNDEQQISKLFEDGDRALVAADVEALSRVYADDYVQYDESGKLFTKQDVLNNLKSGAILYISMVSTGRRIRMLLDDVAIVNGSEEDEVDQGGQHFPVRYVYMDVVMKREGKWQIVGSQLAR
jgi:ketosteroid isomerase-like protein